VIRRVDGGDRLEFPIGTTLVQPGAGGRTGLGFARISADGQRVAFIHYRAPASLYGRVSTVDRTGTVTSLSDESLNVHGLAWMGDEIWYTAADAQPLFRALWAVTPGSKPRVITRMPGNATLWDATPDRRLLIAHTDDRAVMLAHGPGDVTDRDLSWLDSSWVGDLSDNGKLLLFTEAGQGGGPEGAAYLRGTDGSPAVRLGAGRALALSPDTQWAICCAVNLPSPYLELLPTGTGEPRRLPGHGLAYLDARWLPDGKRIIAWAMEPDHQPRLYLLESDHGPPKALTPEGVISWVLSPDGSTLAARQSGSGIRQYPVDGGAPRDVLGMTGRESPVGWIDDGLLVMRPGDPAVPPGEIYRVDVSTGRRESWKNIFPRDRAGIMAMVTFRATRDGRTQAYSWHRALSNLYVAEGFA
jgi:hypothetical protein